MFGANKPATFTTGAGSLYTVTAKDVFRQKNAGAAPVKDAGRNIFYVKPADGKTILKNKKKFDSARVEDKLLSMTVAGDTLQFKLHGKPRMGVVPVEMVLKSDGSFADAPKLRVDEPITDFALGKPKRDDTAQAA